MPTNLTFLRTRHNYDSYTDYWALVTLSGYPVIYADEADLSDETATYVLSPYNGEWPEFIAHNRNLGITKRCRVFLWNLERPTDGLSYYIRRHLTLVDNGYLDGVLVSDIQLAMDTAGYIFQYVPLGSHPALGSVSYDKTYDLIHLSCYSPRRAFMFRTPEDHYKELQGMSVAPNGWGHERDKALKASRAMLNVHQDDTMYIEPLRIALAAAYGLPVISECIYPSNLVFYRRGLYHQDLPNLMATARRLLDDYDALAQSGLELKELLTVHSTFRAMLDMWMP